MIFFGISTVRPPFDDARVRRALNYAVDVPSVLARTLGSAGDALDAPIPPRVEGYCANPDYGYDVAKARALLAEAGVRNGTRIAIIAPRGRYMMDAALPDMIAPYLREVGFQVDTRVVEGWSEYLEAIRESEKSGPAQLHLFGWSPFLQTGASYLEVFSSHNTPPYGPATTFYRNDVVDSLIEVSQTEGESVRRGAAACEAADLERRPMAFPLAPAIPRPACHRHWRAADSP